ncbi:MAG TPA: LysR family transcriptional regulator, partial [Sphingomicrobium sp.]|nr:LysR family transcriptional regulator [Sphingomicrobium sp.]
IRVTGDEALGPSIIVPAVTHFAQRHPDVLVEIDISAEVRDLSAGEADIALRGGLEPAEPSLVRRKLADDRYGVYCSWSYPSPPLSRAEMHDHPIACLESTLERIEAAGFGHCVKHVVNSISSLRALISEGNVIGGLPAIIAEVHPPLRLCFPVEAQTAVWVAYPERLRHVPEIKQMSRLLAEQFRRYRDGTRTDGS